MASQPPDSLLRARRALEGLSFYQLIDDWEWNGTVKKWVLKCRFTIEAGSDLIPAQTDWFVLADDDYPWGVIELHPAKSGGITHTFPHQSCNAAGKAELPWRNGNICAQTSMRFSGRCAYDIEPFAVDERLLWRMVRAKEWLEAAVSGRLTQHGEPYELPDFHIKVVGKLGFVEDEETFKSWQKQTLTLGIATLIHPEGVELWDVVAEYADVRGKHIRSIEHGVTLSQRPRRTFALWIRLTAPPVYQPWKAPETFGELRDVLKVQKIDFNGFIRTTASKFRDGKRHLLLLGFPVPTIVGEIDCLYHWQGLRLPPLSNGELNGYRSTEENYIKNDIQKILADSVRIDWVASDNWAEEQIRTRGRASPRLSGANVLLIGAGAMGSSIGELLIREGCMRLTVVDDDILNVGNLCRHTLTLQDVGTPKARALATRLNSISPHATVLAIIGKFYDCTSSERQQMDKCDIIIDCTGEDKAAYQLGKFPWTGSKLFISVSVGIKACRLFVFAAQGAGFPHAVFMNMLTPWLQKELKKCEGLKLPREGIGCWHPVFPARADDIWLMSSVAVKCIATWVDNPPGTPCLNIFEQEQKEGQYIGVRKVETP